MLEMRNVSKSFSGVQALSDVNFSVEAGQIHAARRRERCRQVHADEGAQRRLPAGSYEGTIIFDGEERRFRDIDDSEALGIIIIHQELALIPLMSIAENIFLSQPPSRFGVIDRDEVYRRTRELLAQGRPEGVAGHADHRSRRRQAAAGRDREGAVQAGAAADPGRADREPERDRQRRAARTLLMEFRAQGIASILISHKLNEVAKVADHITVLRDGRPSTRIDCRAEPIQRGPHHPQHGRPRYRPSLSRSAAPKIGETVFEVRELVGLPPHPSRAAGDQGRRIAACGAARSSALPG